MHHMSKSKLGYARLVTALLTTEAPQKPLEGVPGRCLDFASRTIMIDPLRGINTYWTAIDALHTVFN